MLASILGYTELALDTKKVKEDEKLTRYLTKVIEASGKSSELVSQMLIFSRAEGDNSKKEEISASIIMDNIKHLLQPLTSDNISLTINTPIKDLLINVSPILITQVLMNLYLNSKDSVGGNGGVITITVKMTRFDSATNKACNSCHKNIQGEYVEFSVEDNGCGISSENINHIFEPFFTTKDVGKGTGMGLSMVHGIIHKHQGHILIDSEIGVGTTVKFLLPKVNEIKNVVSDDEVKDIALYKDKHVVLIDDEVSLTTYLSEYLQLQGFIVKSFNDSEKLYHIYRKHPIRLISL